MIYFVSLQSTPSAKPASKPQRMTLKDIKSLEHIDELSSKQMKELLVTNFVDIKGCVEKREFTEKLKRLWTEQNKNDEGQYPLYEQGLNHID